MPPPVLGFGVLLSGLVVLVKAVRRRRTLGLFGFGIPLPSPDIFGAGSFGLLKPVPVSDGLGTGLLRFGLKPVPVSDGLGTGIPIVGRPAIALALRLVLAIALCLETSLRDLRTII